MNSSFGEEMARIWLSLAGIYGVLGVGAGAFGAHALKKSLEPELLVIFETGSRYCLIHAVALLAVGILAIIQPTAAVNRSGWFFSIGIAVFSGTLWILALSGQKWLGAVTPIGGLCLILGWLMLLWVGVNTKVQHDVT